MTAESQSLQFEKVIRATPEEVYYALTNESMLTQWLCQDARLTVAENGRLYFYWPQGYYAVGNFTDVSEKERVAFSWRGKDEPGMSHVTIDLQAVADGTQISLRHENLGSGEAWQSTIRELGGGWESGLENLQSVLERGLDKRVYDRPLLGIIPTAQLSAEQMAHLGLPAAGGVRISGTVPNTGAVRAGLQAEDIITRLGDSDITGFAAFAPAVAGKQVGDEVAVVFYRDGQEQRVRMPLSARPAPNVPDDLAALTEQVRQIHTQLDKRLEELLADVTEAEAGARPPNGEWTVKEILAHLILSERGTQFGLAVQLNGQALTVFPNNPDAATAALLTVYPTLPELVQAWQQAEAETVALLCHLPADFVARKVDYLNNGLNLLLGLPGHTQSHYQDVERVLTAVRQGKSDDAQ